MSRLRLGSASPSRSRPSCSTAPLPSTTTRSPAGFDGNVNGSGARAEPATNDERSGCHPPPCSRSCCSSPGCSTAFSIRTFGFDRDSAVLFAGLLVALVASTVVFSLPAVVMMRVRHGEWGHPSALPGALPIAAACVLLSRVAHFQPGYLYGAILGFGFAAELSKDEEGQTVAITVIWTLMISAFAWIVRTPVHTAATKPGAGFAVQMLDTALASIVVVGIEGAVIGLLPLQVLDGARLKQWNRTAWLAIFGVALFAFVDILLNPASGYVSSTSRGAVITTAIVFAGFGLGSVAFWAYFRYRPAARRPRTTQA